MITEYRYILIVFFSISFFSFIKAQQNESPKKMEYAKNSLKLFSISLESDIPGIVESTIYNVILAKKYYPEGNYSSILNRLNEIVEKYSDPLISYKAHLATIYLTFSNLIEIWPISRTFEREYIFRQIAEQLNKRLLGSRN